MRPLLLLLVLGLASGCYRVRIETDPIGATVGGPGLDRVGSPSDVRLRPLGSREITVSATGHRSLTFELRWRLFGWLRSEQRMDVRLVPEHGPPGTAR